jgi:pyridoxine 5-phosphate synthase
VAVSLHQPVDLSSADLPRALLRRQTELLLALTDVRSKDVALVFVDDESMGEYNQRYRNKQGPTNVLAFPAQTRPDDPTGISSITEELGDIIISVETAAREARNENRTLPEQLLRLMIHGLLHLQGWDHERSEAEALQMWDREEELYHLLTVSRRSCMPTQLAINVDHVATVRQARGGKEPDPVAAAAICELAGAVGIVVHLREDRRHIQDRDVRLLRETVKTKLNLEMATAREIVDLAVELKPDLVTLVPEKREELTTEGGLDVIANAKKVEKTIKKMSKAGIPVSLFIDPDAAQIEAAKEIGATYVELHTGRYCEALSEEEQDAEFRLIETSAALALESGLRVNAGHGLDYRNTRRVAELPTIEELSIGHAVISRAVFVGLDQAVREMLAQVQGG